MTSDKDEQHTRDPRAWANPPPSWRRRLGTVVLVGALALIFVTVSEAWPKDVSIEVEVASCQGLPGQLSLEIAQDGEAMQRIERQYTPGSPRRLRETRSLRDGSYALLVEFVARDGTCRASGDVGFSVPGALVSVTASKP